MRKRHNQGPVDREQADPRQQRELLPIPRSGPQIPQESRFSGGQVPLLGPGDSAARTCPAPFHTEGLEESGAGRDASGVGSGDLAQLDRVEPDDHEHARHEEGLDICE